MITTNPKQYKVPPIHVAFVNLNKRYDLSHAAQLSLATTVGLPHVIYHLIGNTMDFDHPKVHSKVKSWGIEGSVPFEHTTLESLRERGYRLIGTAPQKGSNALNFQWKDNDVIVIGGANGLSDKTLADMDDVITIPSAIDFLTVPIVLPTLVYPILNNRGLWK